MTMGPPPSFTIGVEEEYLIVDRKTRDLVVRPDPAFLKCCEDRIGSQVTPEYLQCQVEIGTKPVQTAAEAFAELRKLRRGVADACEGFGYAPIAASTHPFAEWRAQATTPKPRYQELSAALADIARRMVICGCHVHVCIDDPDLRIDLMNQAVYFLPHLLALSCSSPFWRGEDTGLASYRLTIFDGLPRTGLPDRLDSFGDYERLVQHLVQAGSIEDATKIWWDVRPSARFPTLEQRITDVCTRVEDTITIAALFQSLLRYLYDLRRQNQRWRVYPPVLIGENRWRAQRYGTEGMLVDHGRCAQVPLPDLVDEIVEITGPAAAALGCTAEAARARDIAAHGTSSTRQRLVYKTARESGASPREALESVVDHLIAETVHSV